MVLSGWRGAVHRASGLLEDWPVLGALPVLVQGGDVVLLRAGQGLVRVHFQSHRFVPHPREFILREALGLSWRAEGRTITVTQEGAVLVSSGSHNQVPLAGGLDSRRETGFLTVLEAASPRPRHQQSWLPLRPLSLVCRSPPLALCLPRSFCARTPGVSVSKSPLPIRTPVKLDEGLLEAAHCPH